MNVMTWNMQASNYLIEDKWQTDVKRLFTQTNAQIDVLLLQEAGSPPADTVVAQPPGWWGNFVAPNGLPWGYFNWRVGTLFTQQALNIFWVMLDFENNTNNLALVWDTSKVSANNLLYVANPNGGRPSIGISATTGASTYNLFTIHSLAPNGLDSAPLINAISQVSSKWLAAGYYHCAPGSFALPSNANFCKYKMADGVVTDNIATNYAISLGPAIEGELFTGFSLDSQPAITYSLTS